MESALAQGFEDCEVYFEATENFEVLVLEGEISHYENSSQIGICFRGIYKGNMGYAYATTMNEKTIQYIQKDFEGILFTNLVDYDMVYGHRNDVEGYKNALLYFDQKLPEIINNLKQQDILFITINNLIKSKISYHIFILIIK